MQVAIPNNRYVSDSVFVTRIDGENETLGDIWGSLIQAGVQTGTSYLDRWLSGGSGDDTQARGLQEITAFGNQVIQTLRQILAGLQGGQISPQDALSNAQRIAGYLSNSQYVYQAKSGDDAAALQQFKVQAAQLVQQIQAFAGNVPAGNGAAGVPPAGQSGAGGFSLSPAVLMLVGGGLLAVMLLKR